MRSVLGALVLALAAVAPAAAQGISPLEPPDTERYLRWGPLRVRPGLTIPTLGYDSNVYAIPENSAQQQIGDYFLALSPRLEGVVLFGHRAFLTFDEKLEFYLYAKENDLNYFNQYGKARLTVPFRKIGVYGDIGFDRTRDRPYDAQERRPIRKNYPLGVGLITKLGWRTDSELGVFQNRYSAEDPDDPCPGITGCPTVAQLNDRTEDGGRFRARYLIFGRTRLLVDLAARDIEFDDAATAAQRDGRERRQMGGLDFGIGGRIFGTLRFGHASFDLVNPAVSDFDGAVADVALGYNLGSMGSRITLTGARDVRYTIYNPTPLYVYTGGELGLVRYFNRFIGMELTGGRATLDFLGTVRHDDRWTGGAGVRFRFSENNLGRRVEYTFRYTRVVVDSTLPVNDQNRGTMGFGVTVGY